MVDNCVLIKPVNLIYWNINYVKNKFMAKDVRELFQNKDLVIIMETQFNVKTKCPDGVFVVARSRFVDSKNFKNLKTKQQLNENRRKPSGGVATL